MQSLADNHAREFSRVLRDLHNLYGQIAGYLTHEARSDSPGGAPKKAERALEEMQRKLHEIGRTVARLAEAEIASLRNYTMVSTDRARSLLSDHARANGDLLHRLGDLFAMVRLGTDPAANVKQIGDLDGRARKMIGDLERAETDLLGQLRRG